MCGLVCVLGDQAEERATLALSKMLHRGVRTGVAAGRGGAVGHRRLPIVGVGPEYDQPARAGPWLVGFVGELLDFRDDDPGRECDYPLVLETWHHRGPAGFGVRDGFWCIMALNDDGSLHVLLDYLAQKPAYFRSDDFAIAAASEPDALVALGPVTPDEVYFSSVVKWGYCPEGWRTPYDEIQKLGPGFHLVMRPDPGDVTCQLVDELRPRAFDPEALKDEVEWAVKRRAAASDVPVAALVSGGLDSAVTYALARRYADVRPFHVENGELGWAARVVGGVAGMTTLPDVSDPPVDRCLDWMQEPLDLGSLAPQVRLSEAVGLQGYNVCLTGDGADELFGGYRRSARYDSQASDVWHELVSWHLPRLDRVMMRNRVEVRSPFLARRVAEYALGLPRVERTGKRVLKELFRRDLPPGVADRAKVPLKAPRVAADPEGWRRTLVDRFRETRGLAR